MAFIANTLSNLPPTSGRIFFVSSTGNRDTGGRASDANAGRDPNIPLATIDAAVARCTASRGDMIVVMPGHTESLPATDITLDVAGVSVIGLGTGGSRPTLTYAATGSLFTVTAANCRISNIEFTPGIASVVQAINVSAANCEIDNCKFNSAAAFEFLRIINLDSSATGTIIRDNKIFGLDGAAGATAIALNGCDQVQILRNIIQGDFSTGAIENVTASAMQTIIADNIVSNQSTSGTITMLATATGVISNNMLSNRTTGLGAASFAGGDCLCNQNFYVNDEDEANVIVPTTAST
jgi:hypothetical protein